MKLTHSQFQDIGYMAENMEESNSFEIDIKTFVQYVEELKDYLYYFTDNPKVLRLLDKLPIIDFKNDKPDLVDYLLPKPSRKMWGGYKRKQKILSKVKQTAHIFSSIHDLLEYELD